MTYIKLDDKIMDHPKIVAAGPMPALVFIAALCYSSRHLTDGALHQNVIEQLSSAPMPRKHAATLVKVGLLDVTPDGWQIRNYTEWQTTRAKVETVRAKRAAAGAKGGQANGKQTASTLLPLCEANGTPEDRRQKTEVTTNPSSPLSVTRSADEEDPRIGQVLARIAESRAAGRNPKPNAKWHETTIANLRASENLDVEAARIFHDFPTAPVALVAGRILGEDSRNLAMYRRLEVV